MLQRRSTKAELLQLAEYDFDLHTRPSTAEEWAREHPSDAVEEPPVRANTFATELWALATVLADLSYHGVLQPRTTAADIPDGALEVAKAILGTTKNGGKVD